GLAAAIARGRVFARVDPVQKLEIVGAQRAAGHFAAVTGDGVNDAPALRAADIGVAMGRGGTDVARDAADLVLTDDNFASIVNGVEEGRIAYDNVRKVTYLLISTGAAEIVLFFCAVVAGLPLPLLAVQLLWLNLVTNGIQDVALAFEKGEPGVLGRPPRPPRQPLIDSRMIAQTAVSGLAMGAGGFLFYRWALGAGWEAFEARNALLLLMVLFENAQAFNCRSEARSVFAVPVRDNPLLILAVIAAQGVHLGAMYLPGLRDVLDLEPVSLERWLTVAGFALGLIVVMELFKAAGARLARADFTT
ncbi:MAG: HAD-IC family P-type ATPase, partial [Alphaproteobacteria bacterium]